MGVFFLSLVCFGIRALAAEVHVTIDGSADPRRPVIKAPAPAGITESQAKDHLKLVRLNDNADEGPPIFGDYRLNQQTIEFTPAFQLAPGGRFRAILTASDGTREAADYIVPALAPTTAPSVAKVYPSGDGLPANLLKFYIYFATPMRQTDRIFDQLHILDDSGKPVSDPWRRLQQWSDDGQRLTLWIHPGRVKHGVNLREELGPVLESGKKYKLVIDSDVTDLNGSPLGKPYEKAFTATAEDHARISLPEWKLIPPAAGTREPLKIAFPKPLDEALLRRLIRVKDESGVAVPGSIEIADHEMSWRFIPDVAWGNRSCLVDVNELMEDLAGNTPVRVFDTDMKNDPIMTKIEPLRFKPRAGDAR